MSETLKELIPSYYLNKQEADSYKKICDAQNKEIKNLMAELGQDKYDVEDYHAVRSISTRESFNEIALIELLKSKLGADTPIIKTKEYVDMDALEKNIYNGEVTKETLLEMEKCKNVTEVVTLKITKKKGKK